MAKQLRQTPSALITIAKAITVMPFFAEWESPTILSRQSDWKLPFRSSIFLLSSINFLIYRGELVITIYNLANEGFRGIWTQVRKSSDIISRLESIVHWDTFCFIFNIISIH